MMREQRRRAKPDHCRFICASNRGKGHVTYCDTSFSHNGDWRRQHHNYRPITVLNTDYKIFTKAIATRLTEIAPNIIHPDQADFIRGWSIFNQIEQTAMTINYARLKEINGAMVALDKILTRTYGGSSKSLASQEK
jgi:hypothetical protein